jgi:hypothetical protein
MSLEKCNSCGSEFLTEADPYIVRPTKDGLKLYCSCYIVGHNQFDHVDKIKELETKNAELEKKLVEAEKAFEDKKRAINAAINMWDIETKKLEIAVEALEDFILENDHLPECVYKNRYGYAYECKCMDRNYYNKDAVIIRARKALAAINGE